jgi:hypothetical protein
VVVPFPITLSNRGLIIFLAAKHHLPAIYPFRYFANEGGLMSYGSDQIDEWRGAATSRDAPACRLRRQLSSIAAVVVAPEKRPRQPGAAPKSP